MNFIKRFIYACSKVCSSRLVSILATLMGVFYFVVAIDLFWYGTERWQTAGMTVLFNAPIVIFVVVAVASFIYYFMQKKVEQQAASVEKRLREEQNKAEVVDAQTSDVQTTSPTEQS